MGVVTLFFLYFLPPILSGLRYQWRVTRGLFAWIFGKRVHLETFNVTLNLSEREKKHLLAEVPPFVPIQAGVRLLWWRRLGKHWRKWWWGNRRVATPTWLLLTDKALILLPDMRQRALEIMPFDQVRSIEVKRGIVKGSLKIILMCSQQVQVYECAVLRPEWNAVETLVKPFQARQARSLQQHPFYPSLNQRSS